MLNFLVATAGARTNLESYFSQWGESIAHRVAISLYGEVDVDAIRGGSVVFCDVDVMDGDALAAAGAMWSHLEGKPGFRLLNRPGKALGRYALLRALHDGGHNSFNVFRLEELHGEPRYPVFLRRAADHAGALSPLLHGRAELDDAITRAVADGALREELIAVEFIDTAVGGRYRKYSAVKAGDALIAHHIFISRHWQTKPDSLEPPTLDSIVEEAEFQLANPHRDAVETAFRIGNIDFGRIDYGVRGDRVEVWEINTMPTLLQRRSYYTPAQMHAKRWFAGTLNSQFKRLSVSGQRSRRPRPGRGTGR